MLLHSEWEELDSDIEGFFSVGAIFRDSGELQCNRPLSEEHAASQKGHLTCGAIFGLALRNSVSVQQSRYIIALC